MTRRLIIQRHAKSDWHQGLDDHARPLNDRGRRTAPQIAAYLVALGWVPEVVWSSDSERTRETWGLMADAYENADVHFTRSLYLADSEQVCEVVSGIGQTVQTALLLGHNPGLGTAVLHLCGFAAELRTADAVLLESDDEWADSITRSRRWRLVRHVVARDVVP